MLNLNEYDPNAVKPGEERRYFNYEGFFGGILRKDGFGLQGAGSLSLDTPQTRINLVGETPLTMLISVPLAFIPVIGRAIRTFYRPQADFSFQFADVSELIRKGYKIQFKAPKRAGGKPKRVEFSAKTEAEAEQIESAIRHYKPDVTPGKLVSGWHLVKYALAGAVVLVGLFLIVLVGAGILRYAEKPASVYATVNRQLKGTYSRKYITPINKVEYPEEANGILKSGGDVFIIATISPEGNVTDVKINDKHTSIYRRNTDNPILIEAAMNAARQIKAQPDKQESEVELLYNFRTRLDYAFMRF